MSDDAVPRRLLIVRHAQAAREPPGGGPDRERPLTDRGEQDARQAGARLHTRGMAPDLVLSSPAARAIGTAEILAERMRFDAAQIQLELAIYNASRSTLLELLSDTDDAHRHLAIIGHNPGLSELASALSSDPIDGMPPCGIVSLALPSLQEWAALRPGIGQLEFVDYGRTIS